MDNPQEILRLMHRPMVRPDLLVDVASFHEQFGLEYHGKPRGLEKPLIAFRGEFMLEELTEWLDNAELLADELSKAPEYRDKDKINLYLEECFDALLDLQYVLIGTAYLQGFLPYLEEGWRRVQRANMSKVRKLRADGTETNSGRDAQYDVVKPADFVAPQHVDLVCDNAHNDDID